MPISVFTLFTASTASPSEASGARLNESVTTGNWPWWFTVIGALDVSTCVKALSGTCPPFGNAVEEEIPLPHTVLEAIVGLLAEDDVEALATAAPPPPTLGFVDRTSGWPKNRRRPSPARGDRDEQRQLRIETMTALGVALFVLALVLVLAEAHLSTGGLIGACAILAAIGGITLLLLAAGAGAAVVLIVALCAAMAAMSLLLLARRRILRPQLARPRTGREALVGHHGGVRSEERRGGKEGKCRWS